MQKKKFPIGIQTFEKIISDGYCYVDKTELVYKLVSTGQVYFLSRPRRFGKSLLLSTLEAYFQGRRDLFKGLAIEKLETEWSEYPVLRLDFNKYYVDTNDLEKQLGDLLTQYENVYNLTPVDSMPVVRFTNLIHSIYQKTGMKVVVIIDEYDKPILDAIGNDSLMESNRLLLKNFYGVLKSADQYLKFVFLTGITKFSQVSIFSGLNQLKDISMYSAYDTICGITESELEYYFHDDIVQLAKTYSKSYDDMILFLRRMYDGYHFSGGLNGVYNPFSILSVLDSKMCSSYWFQTATPSYLFKLLKNSSFNIDELEQLRMKSIYFADYRADVEKPIPMLYQSGYLTIKGYDFQSDMYTLGYPNMEVKNSFVNFLANSYAPSLFENYNQIDLFRKEIESGDVDAFMRRFKSFVASIDYRMFGDKPMEKSFQMIFYLLFSVIGADVRTEQATSSGRIDAVVKTSDKIYIFEFKLDGSVQNALKQIEDRRYADPYLSDGRAIIAVGVNFVSEGRKLDSWQQVVLKTC